MVKTTREGQDGQDVHEEIRKVYKHNLHDTLKANGAYRLARHVDEQPLIKAQLQMYDQYHRNLQRSVKYIDSDEGVQKARDRYGSGYGVGELSLTEPFERIYFDRYGVGFDGSPFPSRIGGGYVCPGCGLKMLMSMKTAPPNCPICGRITPLGRFIRDGYYKR